MNTRRIGLWGITVLGLTIILGALFPNVVSRVAYAVDSAQASAAYKQLATASDLSAAFENVADVIKPSMVSVSSVKEIKASRSMQQLPRFFFGTPFGEQFGNDLFRHFAQPESPGQGYVQKGLGTGVIVSDDGYILTNNHVVKGADKVTVKLSDDRSYTAKVVGTDPKTDVAVLKIPATDLHPARLGDSDKLRVGEWVVAAGNPFGLTATITSGIVSAKGRANVGIADYEDFIQTDAAINPGNSGGPLVNLHGEVVGINTAIFTKSGGYMGVGFAIPINMAKSIMDSLIDDGRVVRGWLGAAIQNLNDGLAQSFGYEGTDGVLLGDVTPGGPADKAGLEPGDIVVRFDGKKSSNIDKLRSQVAATKPDTTVRVVVFRKGKTQTIKVKVGELESQMAAANGSPSSTMDLGMTVRTLTPDIAQQLGYDSDQHGVVVTNVDPLGMAAKAGIRPHDVILKVQGVAVASVSQLRNEIRKYDLDEGVRLRIRSGPNERFAFIRGGDGHVG